MTTDSFAYRPARHDDVSDVHALWADCQEDLTGQRSVLLEDFERWWSTPGFDLAASTRVARAPDGRLAGYGVFFDMDPIPVSPFLNARVHPDFEGRGIGTALLRWGEATAPRVFERLDPDLRVVLQLCRLSHHEATLRLFTENGYSLTRHSCVMQVDLDDTLAAPRRPPGIDLIPYARRGNLLEMLDAKREAFLDHRGAVEGVDPREEERWLHAIANGAEDPDLWYLAMDGEEIAGVCLCAPRSPGEDGAAYVDTVAVRRPWRRRGVGLALLLHAFRELRAKGHARATLDVDAENLTGAVRLYEKAGMSVLRGDDTWEKELRPGRDVRNLGGPAGTDA